MYFPRNWEFGSALAKLRNFGGGLNPPGMPVTEGADTESVDTGT
jgi:hypothetical protein